MALSICKNICVFLLPSLALLMSACSQQQTRTGDPRSPVGFWVLKSIDEELVVAPSGAMQPTLEVSQDGQVSGVAGINNFTGRGEAASWSAGRWSGGPYAVTRMAGTPEAMDFESQFLRLLIGSSSFTIEKGVLTLHSADGRSLEFKPSAKD